MPGSPSECLAFVLMDVLESLLQVRRFTADFLRLRHRRQLSCGFAVTPGKLGNLLQTPWTLWFVCDVVCMHCSRVHVDVRQIGRPWGQAFSLGPAVRSFRRRVTGALCGCVYLH